VHPGLPAFNLYGGDECGRCCCCFWGAWWRDGVDTDGARFVSAPGDWLVVDLVGVVGVVDGDDYSRDEQQQQQ